MSNFPTSYEYIIDNIKEDYEYFNISFTPTNSKMKCQSRYLELSKMSFKALFQFEVYENFEDSYYNKHIYLTKEILDDITNNTKDIVNLNLYKLLLFINICKVEENQEKYGLYDEEHDIYDIKKYKLFYDNEFTQYFNNKYKENSTIINDKMSKQIL